MDYYRVQELQKAVIWAIRYATEEVPDYAEAAEMVKQLSTEYGWLRVMNKSRLYVSLEDYQDIFFGVCKMMQIDFEMNIRTRALLKDTNTRASRVRK